MLGLAAPHKGDLLYDLGCGDGRIVVAAARNYGCRAVGFDIDPQRVAASAANVRKNGLDHLAAIEQQDMFTVNLSQADVVTVYLLPELNSRLIPRFATMKPGARIVSHDFDMKGIIPDRVVQLYVPRLHMYKTIYLWVTPLKRASVPVRREWANSVALTA
ncbi:MAG: methyltransferase domain-containing protein [Desulfobulbus sp.]|nr:MAG: methyltransferase domain-containing protein [Desulfobulbus sp.]